MRVPHVRFTVRRMMVAIAVIAIICGAYFESWARRARFRAVAQNHIDSLVDKDPSFPYFKYYFDPILKPSLVPIDCWHIEMIRKYDRAARYPWLPVAPDPPEPE